MSKYVYYANSSVVSVTNIETGEQTQFFSTDTQFARALEFIKSGEYEKVEQLSVKIAVQNVASELTAKGSAVRVYIKNNIGYVDVHGFTHELSNALTTRIVKMREEGFDSAPLIKFIGNLYDNPSSTAVNELFLFLDASTLPITEDGCFIAYKIVRNDYLDCYTGKMDNSVGKIVQMPRNQVDDKRENTCSRGLHFCSRSYLPHYGSYGRSQDRCVLVKINPADVVSIPSDYNNAKGRTWRYEVVGEVTGNWRETLPTQDYNAKSVVNERGTDTTTSGNLTLDALQRRMDATGIRYAGQFGSLKKEWLSPTGHSIGRKAAKIELDCEYSDLDFYEQTKGV